MGDIFGASRWPLLSDDLYSIKARAKDMYPAGIPMDHILKKDGTNIFVIAANGLERDNFDIFAEDDVLHIKATHDPKAENDSDSVVLKHSLIQKDMHLTIAVGATADLDNVQIKIDRGNLIIEIPTKEECKPKRREFTIK